MSRLLKAVLAGTAMSCLALDAAEAQTQSPETPPAATPAAADGATPLPPVVIEQAKPTAPPSAAKPSPKAEPATDRPPSAPKKPQPKKTPQTVTASPAIPPPSAEPVTTIDPTSVPPLNAGTPGAKAAPVLGLAGQPGGQTVTTVERDRYDTRPVFSVTDILREVPGISVKQGNGPRDSGLAIRGSNARNGFGIRNIVVLEDGFVVTQPDGLSRTDITDPHAYGAIDVWRGPSSALFGNYALGGALNFRTRTGAEIDGFEIGADIGSFNYFNEYITLGKKVGAFETSLFASDVRGDGFFGYSAYYTQTVNGNLVVQLSPDDKLTLKIIHNQLETQLPFRLSLNQYRLNPFQLGCEQATGAAAGCVTSNFSRTGVAPFTAQTAAQAGAGRDDRRTIFGIRWEHNFDPDTVWRVQYVFDDRNINQPTGTTAAVGDYLSHNIITDLSHRHFVGGLPSTFMLGLYWNYLPVEGQTYSVAPGGEALSNRGLLSQLLLGYTQNWGGRAREEIRIGEAWLIAAGLAVEKTKLHGLNTAYTYSAAGALTKVTSVGADRDLTNTAPELSLVYRPGTDWQARARLGFGYGVPQISNLFVTPAGTPGNNTDLLPQRNIGIDLGFDWTPGSWLSFSVTGFYEFWQNEIVSQSPGVGLSSYQFNAPGSEHRGFEVAATLKPAAGWKFTAAYLFNDQYYTDYFERLSDKATLFDRAGFKIPGVSPHELTVRAGYDEPAGVFKGLGAFVEYQWRDAFFVENANLLSIPGAHLWNLNVHYDTRLDSTYFKSMSAFFEVRNLFDAMYIASANNITEKTTDTAATLANTTGSIYAGAPRTFYGGVKFKY